MPHWTPTRTSAPSLPVALGGLPTVFALWWMYFASGCAASVCVHAADGDAVSYGHYVVFAAAAAVGAALAVNVAHVTHVTHGPGARALTDVQAAAVTQCPSPSSSPVWLAAAPAGRPVVHGGRRPSARRGSGRPLPDVHTVRRAGYGRCRLAARRRGSVVLGRHGRVDG
ncbi:low temperature requirement protein A [Streptomyces sp. KL116D]|uniref:low temperature requirement protein A n=1 Tax=Streptomyces sp. KL116D TaxID=3045152 RepID=UPI003556B24C